MDGTRQFVYEDVLEDVLVVHVVASQGLRLQDFCVLIWRYTRRHLEPLYFHLRSKNNVVGCIVLEMMVDDLLP